MLVHKVRDVVDDLVDDDVHARRRRGVRLHFLHGYCFRHVEGRRWKRGEGECEGDGRRDETEIEWVD